MSVGQKFIQQLLSFPADYIAPLNSHFLTTFVAASSTTCVELLTVNHPQWKWRHVANSSHNFDELCFELFTTFAGATAQQIRCLIQPHNFIQYTLNVLIFGSVWPCFTFFHLRPHLLNFTAVRSRRQSSERQSNNYGTQIRHFLINVFISMSKLNKKLTTREEVSECASTPQMKTSALWGLDVVIKGKRKNK